MSVPATHTGATQAPPRNIAVLLAAITAIGPFSIDAYLPSFADIGRSLQATPLEVQQTLAAYLIPFAVMILWHGAISDALGRRRVILAGLALYLLASVACLFASTIEHLWLARAAQGVSAGVGMVVGRAVIRDLYEGPAAQKLMAQVSLMFAIAPAAGPILGGFLQEAFGWRAIFVFLAIFAALLLMACARWLPETLPVEKRQSLHPGELWHAVSVLVSDRVFLALCGALALNFAGMFIYVLSAPTFLMGHLGLGETDFGWLFVPLTAGMMLGASLSGRLAGKRSPRATLRLAYWIMAGAMLVNLVINLWQPAAFFWYIACLPIYTAGMSLAMPSLTLMALDRAPLRRGLAASAQGFINTGTMGLASGLLVPLIWGSTLSLSLGMACLLGCGVLFALLARRAH